MKFKNVIQLFLVVTVVFIASQKTNAQYAYGLSDIVYDNTTKKVTSFSRTSLDYRAGLHYDPAVVGGVFQEGQLLGYASHTGYSNIFSAIVSLRTTNQSPPDTRYDVLSDHYIVAYFYTDVIILDDPPGSLPRTVRRWYDPLGLSNFGGAADLGWQGYRGSGSRETFWEFQYFYLGTTGRGIIANPTSCQTASGNSALPCPTPTPTTFRVEIRNRFKGNEDLSASTDIQQGLIGAPVQLDAVVTPTNSQTTYRWTNSDNLNLGDQCNTNSICVAVFNSPTPPGTPFYTINLEVRQGNQPVVIGQTHHFFSL